MRKVEYLISPTTTRGNVRKKTYAEALDVKARMVAKYGGATIKTLLIPIKEKEFGEATERQKDHVMRKYNFV